VSVSDERSALARPVSLFDHAQRLHRLNPDRPLADGGRPFPGSGEPAKVPFGERKRALLALLREFLADPALTALDLNQRCTHLAITAPDVTRAVCELAPEPSGRLVQAARWLVRNGTDRRAVLVGLGLLGGNAEPCDIPLLTMTGLLCFASALAMDVLAQIPGAAHDLIWLADRSRSMDRIHAVCQLTGNQDPAVRQWVMSTPRTLLSSDQARRIAETYQLAQALTGPDVDDALWDQAGSLLLAMTSVRDYRSQIGRYEPALAVYQRWAALASDRPPALDRAAMLVMVAEDLATGPAAAVAGDLRASLIGQIGGVLSARPWTQMLEQAASSEDPVQARRANWVTQAAPEGIPQGQLVIRVVVPDPEPAGFPLVEARIVIDETPVIAAAFDRGPAQPPEQLIQSGQLRAADEPHEVKLAEAYCTEECCGALYVTIARDGDQVVWKNWRSPTPAAPPPEVRFDAAAYDREVNRAEQDHQWEWPARTLARLVTEQLRADPTILGQWNCRPGWCTAWLKDFDIARLTFTYPAHRASCHEPFIQFGLMIDIAGQSPKTLATQLIESIQNTDPKSTAEMIGGSKENADRLGLTYRKPTRWRNTA
jgi:hypothetical protein